MNTVKINQLVTAIKEGKEVEENWVSLFAELRKHKAQIIRKYRIDLANIASTEDIIALYEDCLMDTVNRWSIEKHEEYIKYFSASLSYSKKTLLTHNLREKRVLNHKHTVSGEETISPESDTTVFEMQEDAEALDQFESVEADLDIKQLLDVYENSNPKKRTENRNILEVVLKNVGCDTGELKSELLAVMPENTTWNNARQKLARAKTDFKSFYKGISEIL